MNEEEVLRERVIAMGLELGAFHQHLNKSLLLVNAQWTELKTLFVSDFETLQLLENTASWTFKLLHDALWKDVLMGICRFADPAATRARGQSRRNVSLKGMSELLEEDLRRRLDVDIKEFLSTVEPIKLMRDRFISHTDYDTYLGNSVDSLQPINTALVDDSLRRLAHIMNEVEQHYLMNGTVRYQNPHFGPGGATALLATLRRKR